MLIKLTRLVVRRVKLSWWFARVLDQPRFSDTARDSLDCYSNQIEWFHFNLRLLKIARFSSVGKMSQIFKKTLPLVINSCHVSRPVTHTKRTSSEERSIKGITIKKKQKKRDVRPVLVSQVNWFLHIGWNEASSWCSIPTCSWVCLGVSRCVGGCVPSVLRRVVVHWNA